MTNVFRYKLIFRHTCTMTFTDTSNSKDVVIVEMLVNGLGWRKVRFTGYSNLCSNKQFVKRYHTVVYTLCMNWKNKESDEVM